MAHLRRTRELDATCSDELDTIAIFPATAAKIGIRDTSIVISISERAALVTLGPRQEGPDGTTENVARRPTWGRI